MWAGELDIPIILLAQLKESDILFRYPNSWPNANDIYGGGSVQMNADYTAFIHRPEIVTARKEPAENAKDRAEWEAKYASERGQAFFYSDKARGSAGRIRREMIFDGPTMSFRDL